MGGRHILSATATLDLTKDIAGGGAAGPVSQAYEYSDCWVEDLRLVVLNARDAQAHGTQIMTRTKVLSARRTGYLWTIELQDQAADRPRTVTAKMLVNAGGPWVGDIIQNTVVQKAVGINSTEGVRLVRGGHIVATSCLITINVISFKGVMGG